MATPGAELEAGRGGRLGPDVGVPVVGLAHPVGRGVEHDVVSHVAHGLVQLEQGAAQGFAHRDEVLGGAVVQMRIVLAGITSIS